MSMQFKWQGLLELQQQLHALPDHLREVARYIIEDTAQDAAVEIRGAYPRKTGKLASSVTVTLRTSGPYGVVAQVRNTAPHAFIFEHGTVARHTTEGWARGVMPAGNVFLPRIYRHRRRMYERLTQVLRDEGLAGERRGRLTWRTRPTSTRR